MTWWVRSRGSRRHSGDVRPDDHGDRCRPDRHAPPTPLVVGSVMSGERRQARAPGTMLHYLVMGTAVLGLAYGASSRPWTTTRGGLGAHRRDPRSGRRAHAHADDANGAPPHDRTNWPAPASAAPAARLPGPTSWVRSIAAPGVLGKNWGAMTPAGLVMGHAVYGLVAALVYSWIA